MLRLRITKEVQIQVWAHRETRLSMSLKHDIDTGTDALLVLPKQECKFWDII